MSVIGDRILLATDGSLEAESAAGMAVTLSEKLGSGLHVVCVEPMPDPLSSPESRVVAPELGGDIRERAEVEVRKKLEGEAEKIRKMGVEVSGVHAGVGRPDAEIVRVAEELGAGLIVVGSRGMGPVKRAVMGSVSGSVVHTPIARSSWCGTTMGKTVPPAGSCSPSMAPVRPRSRPRWRSDLGLHGFEAARRVRDAGGRASVRSPLLLRRDKGLRPRAGRRRRRRFSTSVWRGSRTTAATSRTRTRP